MVRKVTEKKSASAQEKGVRVELPHIVVYVRPGDEEKVRAALTQPVVYEEPRTRLLAHMR